MEDTSMYHMALLNVTEKAPLIATVLFDGGCNTLLNKFADMNPLNFHH